MYSKHFGINENPFSIAPDPRYLFMSEGHREAFAHLLYGLKDGGGFVLLTGEVGTGKTTVCRCLLEQVPPGSNIAIILNPKVTVLELLASICDELAISYPAGNTSVKIFVDQINTFLLAAHGRGEKTVLIIDEAQNLDPEVLEQVRLLTNLETNRQKLLQIIMLGQPELLAKLERPELRQLAQRITARYHLGPLSRKEISPYVSHRLAVAGLNSQPFSLAALNRLHKLSGGIPRLINSLCDRAMLGAYVQGEKSVSRATMARAAREVFGEQGGAWRNNMSALRLALVAAGLLIAAGAGGATYFKYAHQGVSGPEPGPRQQAAATPAAIKPPAHAEVPPVPLRAEERIGESANRRIGETHQDEEVPGAAQPDTAAPAIAVSDPMAWPGDEPLEKSLPASFAALFARWGLDYIPASEEEGCRYVETAGLRCLQLQGELSSLLRLDQPAVLQLYDPQGGIYHAALVAANERTATLVFGGSTREVNFEEITSRWFGKFTILWRPPPGYPGFISPDFQGQTIAWLDKQMAVLNNQPIPEGRASASYNVKLVKEVKEFQRSKNIAPDGILGPQTLILINRAAGLEMPSLHEKPEAR